ncbi:MAG: 2-C-methyl-D-erythritol 4-phosphate cytidylyltransferase [Elusimicrobiota bacterium]|nr:2-C-methyl-D-erythritol 4-phosphate cytidylyltransferase [Endomicrobiia bacterium]MDW8166256.1 2-C-methyl-D-erythritol 4-phosphate cytidylyltransferase [Elusimicrobiota bacterium]
MKNIGIILAAGEGRRMNTNFPKQFIKIGEKMILEYAIENMSKANVDEIFLVIHPKYLDIGEKIQRKYEKVSKLINGGRTRSESIFNSISYIIDENLNGKIIINDAVRPFVSSHTINEMLDLLNVYPMVVFCSKITGYLVFTGESNTIKKVEDRKFWRIISAPEGYRSDFLREVFKKIDRAEVLRYEAFIDLIITKCPEQYVYLYESEEFNFKITYNSDLKIASLLQTLDVLENFIERDKK